MCSDKLLNADLHNNPFTATCHTHPHILTNSVSPGPDSIWIIQPITRLSSLNRVPDWSMLCSLQMSHAIPDWRVSVCANAWVEKQLRKHEKVTGHLDWGGRIMFVFWAKTSTLFQTLDHLIIYIEYIFFVTNKYSTYTDILSLNSYAIIVHIFAADVFP